MTAGHDGAAANGGQGVLSAESAAGMIAAPELADRLADGAAVLGLSMDVVELVAAVDVEFAAFVMAAGSAVTLNRDDDGTDHSPSLLERAQRALLAAGALVGANGDTGAAASDRASPDTGARGLP